MFTYVLLVNFSFSLSPYAVQVILGAVSVIGTIPALVSWYIFFIYTYVCTNVCLCFAAFDRVLGSPSSELSELGCILQAKYIDI